MKPATARKQDELDRLHCEIETRNDTIEKLRSDRTRLIEALRAIVGNHDRIGTPEPWDVAAQALRELGEQS